MKDLNPDKSSLNNLRAVFTNNNPITLINSNNNNNNSNNNHNVHKSDNESFEDILKGLETLTAKYYN